VTNTLAAEAAVHLPRNYLRPCLLLLLAEGTAHGYELLDQVGRLGLDRVDPGGLYRCLRAMDEEGLVESRWEPSSLGPARRRYAVTDDGREWLRTVASSLEQVHRTLGVFHDRYQSVEQADPLR